MPHLCGRDNTRVSRTSTTRIRRRRIYFPTSRVSQESEGFIFFRRATYKVTYVKAIEFRQGWSVSTRRGREKEEEDQGRWSVSTRRGRKKKRKEKDKGRQEGGSAKERFRVSSTKKFLFLVHE